MDTRSDRLKICGVILCFACHGCVRVGQLVMLLLDEAPAHIEPQNQQRKKEDIVFHVENKACSQNEENEAYFQDHENYLFYLQSSE